MTEAKPSPANKTFASKELHEIKEFQDKKVEPFEYVSRQSEKRKKNDQKKFIFVEEEKDFKISLPDLDLKRKESGISALESSITEFDCHDLQHSIPVKTNNFNIKLKSKVKMEKLKKQSTKMSKKASFTNLHKKDSQMVQSNDL